MRSPKRLQPVCRHALRDALLGLDAADEEQLVTRDWRQNARDKTTHLLLATQSLIEEARASLIEDED